MESHPAGLETDFPAEAGSLMELLKTMALSEWPEQSRFSLSDMWHLGMPTILMCSDTYFPPISFSCFEFLLLQSI